VADAPHFERLHHVPADAAWIAHQPGPESQPQPWPPPVYRTTRLTAREIRLEIPLKILQTKSFGSAECSSADRIKSQVRRDTGAELILIIVLLAGGLIYATLASNPMSFDDLIELRFLPSRRRPRDPEHIRQRNSAPDSSTQVTDTDLETATSELKNRR
jgi:hypothetical protein